ncbi:beta-ketoacyl-ACP synthase [Oricola cellulosilytica]|uniref:Beta-ketoacyl-ACP synthase n=1 Tax=Oricola cellulosilytica TaxID=1429082 RepID=A0A4R0PHC6_9HYPH|nr:beta-ketoacyl-ACP synthase [Oricola cellulosilytica]TCD14994.1 beta-ketoacyl-ACP synthase [Oricola cellulosilytica]
MSGFTDQAGRPVIAITGSGVVSSLGNGKKDNWARLTNGESGIHAIKRFPSDHLRTTMAGTVDFMTPVDAGSTALTFALAEAAAVEAIAESGFKIGDFGGPLFLAAPPVELEWWQRLDLDGDGGENGVNEPGYERILHAARNRAHEEFFRSAQFATIGSKLRERLGTRGLPITLSTACASGATAIQLGVEAIRRGETERVIAVATDGSVTAEALVRFSLLSALSTQNEAPEKASKPFSKDRDGFVMAEGAAAFVMESLESARARGATVLGILEGCGECADDFHRTRSKPDGSPAIAAVRAALDDAGVSTDDIDYVNAHGTSTPENDKMEYLSLSAVFGEKMKSVPISSNKSMIGHTLTAAGAIEAVFSLMTIRSGTLPPTINHVTPDPAIELDVVPNTKRDATVNRVLSNSFGFGGQNTCLVIAAEPA